MTLLHHKTLDNFIYKAFNLFTFMQNKLGGHCGLDMVPPQVLRMSIHVPSSYRHVLFVSANRMKEERRKDKQVLSSLLLILCILKSVLMPLYTHQVWGPEDALAVRGP